MNLFEWMSQWKQPSDDKEAVRAVLGRMLFVSHDREVVSSLATRIIELSASGITNFSGTYEEYLRQQEVTLSAVGGNK